MLQMEAGTMQCFGGAEYASLTCVDSLPCQKNISCERCVPPKLPGVQHDIRVSYSSDTEASGHQLAMMMFAGHHTDCP